ncbi:ABC transporter ATP-binding protein [Lacisediminihabitans changchengi]|uniref:ATP-binding cassette domain-containing protein n=1 Tax=Lacisediminihabitans changchengi TaxID=2787634 RepID=A0A934SQZ7_9MICO|nr:ABC transporter ATP-binding protein [Lacisediminihabitans changchengi]MBK4347390.1 ATP-binding cassette domain-containing protein [Lacisediminihabitans changchengi]
MDNEPEEKPAPTRSPAPRSAAQKPRNSAAGTTGATPKTPARTRSSSAATAAAKRAAATGSKPRATPADTTEGAAAPRAPRAAGAVPRASKPAAPRTSAASKPTAARTTSASKVTAPRTTAASKAAAARAAAAKAAAIEKTAPVDLPETELPESELPETTIEVIEVPEEVAEAAETSVVTDAAAATSAARTAHTRPVTTRPVTTPPRAPKNAPKKSTAPAPSTAPNDGVVLRIEQLTKRFGDTVAVDHVSLAVPAGTIFGLVGPNGAGKTTTLSMVTGLLRPDSGNITVHGANVWTDPVVAKRNMGVLPDRLRLFDRLTGAQLLYYAGTLRGLDAKTVKKRTADLAGAFGLEDALDRLVTDYSAGMTKKVALACAMIHSPRILILDEPFESVDPVSAANVTEILQNYVAAGGTVVLSSHSMDLIQRICDLVAIVVSGKVLAAGTTEEVRGTGSLEEKFVELAGGRKTAEGMEWLHSFSD